MKQTPWDVIIVGAGPAGLMTAITAAQGGLRVLILDSQEKIGAKLLISGGGRCNITNLKVSENDYQCGNPRTVRNVLRAFPPEKVLSFFKTLGVEMVLEEGTKYFPKAQSAKVVLHALLQKAGELHVAIEKGKKVATLYFSGGVFHLSAGGSEYLSKTVVICTGGLSYPGTGSDGSGFELAKALGHSVVPTTPALVPLLTEDADWKQLAGITLPVRLTFSVDGKTLAASEGAFLLTHFGFSGPAILDISGAWTRFTLGQKELSADFLPRVSETELFHEMNGVAVQHPKRGWKRFFEKYFPERLNEVLLKKLGLNPGAPVSQSSKKDRETAVRRLKHFPLQVSDALGYEKAEVTAGGVDLEGVDGKTLESKSRPGLYFAGEILDVTGRIGGFNFQWAWASGFVVGQALWRKLSHQEPTSSGR